MAQLLCGKHHMQGVWGRAAPPAGSARGKARSQECESDATQLRCYDHLNRVATCFAARYTESARKEKKLCIHILRASAVR
jgi:hypothetical protein